MQVVNLCFIWGGSYWIFWARFSPGLQLPEEHGGCSACRKPFVKDINRKTIMVANTSDCGIPHLHGKLCKRRPGLHTDCQDLYELRSVTSWWGKTNGAAPFPNNQRNPTPKITSAASVTRPNAPDLLGCGERWIPHLPLSLLALWTHAQGWDHVWGNCKRWHSECFGPREGRHLVDY